MSDWDEVRRLATDFQRLQAAPSINRLSERNCIELVSRLIQMGQIEVVYTLDGKEYITPQHLEKEIKKELVVHGGRINIVGLQQLLNVDLAHVESKIVEILKHDHSLILLQGELIGRPYMTALCEEVNDTLQEVGQIVISDLSRNFALPNDFLMQHIEAALEKSIKGQLDKMGSGIIFTDSYVSRYRARIRGLFAAITRPTPISSVIVQGQFQEKLFQSVLQALISSGELAGSLRGRMDKAVYIPNVYTQMQNAWADSFLASSAYLEYDALIRMGIDEPKSFIERRYGTDHKVTLLVTCAVGEAVVTEVEAAVEEAQSSKSWVDIMFNLPSPCTTDDANMLLHIKYRNSKELRLFKSIVVTNSFLQSCLDIFNPLIRESAEKAARTHSKLLASMSCKQDSSTSDSHKASQRKSGGKRQGRVKNRDKLDDIDKNKLRVELQFMSTVEITDVLLESYPDCHKEFLEYVAEEIMGILQSRFMESAVSSLSTLSQGGSIGHQRKRHADLQEKLQGLWSTSKLFERALANFEDSNEVLQLSKYLLRTLCSDLANMLILNLAEDSGLTVPSDHNFSSADRALLTTKMPVHIKKYLTNLNDSLSGKDTSNFFEAFETLCGQAFCGIMLKKVDRKKERQLLYSHQQSLLSSLKDEEDPAMALHLTSVLLFQQHTGCIIHVSGKLVPLVINFLKSCIDSKAYSTVTQFQKLVILKWKASAGRRASPQDVVEDKGNEDIPGSKPSDVAEVRTSHMTSADVDKQLRDLIGELKELVIKPQKREDPSN